MFHKGLEILKLFFKGLIIFTKKISLETSAKFIATSVDSEEMWILKRYVD